MHSALFVVSHVNGGLWFAQMLDSLFTTLSPFNHSLNSILNTKRNWFQVNYNGRKSYGCTPFFGGEDPEFQKYRNIQEQENLFLLPFSSSSFLIVLSSHQYIGFISVYNFFYRLVYSFTSSSFLNHGPYYLFINSVGVTIIVV